MKRLDELIIVDDPGIILIREWVRHSASQCEVLDPSETRAAALLKTQVTTHSTLGAIVYETGGILVDHGWLRFLGSGHPRLTRVLPDWNEGRSSGFFLVADDAVGGFFAINGGAFGPDTTSMYYWPPDGLEWEPLKLGFTDFFRWSLTAKLADFYSNLRWPTWKEDIEGSSGDSCFSFYPFLWTREGAITQSNRRAVPIREAFDLKVDIVRQLAQGQA